MYKTVFLLVKATIQTSHQRVREAVAELQQTATCTISDTQKVRIHELKFIDYKLKIEKDA